MLINETSFMLSTYDFIKPDDEDIKQILEESPENFEMANILKMVKINKNTELNYEERMEYYKNLISQIINFTTREYSEEELEICLVFLMNKRFFEEPKVFNLCNNLYDKYKEVTNMTDEIWFLFEEIKYSLLGSYTHQDEWDLERVRILVNSLKKTKEKYEEIRDTYRW